MRSRLIQHPLTHPKTKFPCNMTRSLPKYNNPKQIQIPQLKKQSNQYPDNIASYMFWHFISWGLGTPWGRCCSRIGEGLLSRHFVIWAKTLESLWPIGQGHDTLSRNIKISATETLCQKSLGLKSGAVTRKWTIMVWKSRLDGARRPEHEYHKDYSLKVLPLSILWMRFPIMFKVTTAKPKKLSKE